MVFFQTLRYCCQFCLFSHKSVNLVTGNPVNVSVNSISESGPFFIHALAFFLNGCSGHITLHTISAVCAHIMFHDFVNPSKYQMFS